MVKIISRREWGAKHGRGSKGISRRNEVVGHITVNQEVPADASQSLEASLMRAVEDYVVRERGFDGFPYSFCGFQSGRMYEGRGWDYDGAHTQRGRNFSAYAIARYGHPDVEPSAAFQQSAREVCEQGIRLGKLGVDFLLSGHRDYWNKGCPGTPLYRRLAEWRPGSVITPEEEEYTMKKGHRDPAQVVVAKWRVNQFLHGEHDPRGAGKDYGITISGGYDDQMVAYVREVQKRLGYVTTGEFDPYTLSRVETVLRSRGFDV